jgi:hypothetical protein
MGAKNLCVQLVERRICFVGPPTSRHVIDAARRRCFGKVDLDIEGASIQAEQVLVFRASPIPFSPQMTIELVTGAGESRRKLHSPVHVLIRLCRRRRIKCDEGHPCQACLSANSGCTFEESGKRLESHPHKSKSVAYRTQPSLCLL